MADPLVSVVITLYNYEQYVRDCFKSVWNQSYTNWEMVCVDDGSTDGGKDLKETMDGKFRIVRHSENLGYASAKNSGIIAAGGEYIVMIDADDVLTPNSIEVRLNEFIRNPDLDLVHGLALRWYGGTDLRGYNHKTYVHAQGRMYKRTVYERFGLYYEPLKSMADKEYLFRLGVHPESGFPKLIREKKLKVPVAWYRKHEGQMHKVRRLKPKYNAQIKRVFVRRIKQLKREGITEQNTTFLSK